MSAKRGARGVRPRWRRTRRVLALALLSLVVVGLPLAYATRNEVLGPFVVRQVAARLAAAGTGRLEVERMSGTWFDGLVLEGVRFEASEGPLRRLEHADVALRYTLRGLLGPGGPRVGSVRLEARGLALDLASGEPSAPEAEPSAPLRLPELTSFTLACEDLRLAGLAAEELTVDRASARGSLRAARLALSDARVAAGTNTLAARDLSLDLDAPDAVAFLRGARGRLELRGDDPSALLAGEALPADLRAVLDASLEGGHAELAGELAALGSDFVVRRGGLTLGPDTTDLAGAEWDVDLDLDVPELGPLASLFGLRAAGRVAGDLRLRGPLRSPVGELGLRGRDVRLDRLVLERVDAELVADGRVLDVRSLRVQGPDLEGEARGEVELTPLAFRGTGVELRVGDLQRLDGALPDLRAVELSATLHGPWPRLEGRLEVRAGGLGGAEGEAPSLSLAGSFDPTSVRLERLALESATAELEGSGVLRLASGAGWEAFDLAGDPLALELESLVARTREGPRQEVRLAEPALLLFGADTLEAEELRLVSDLGEAVLALERDPRRTAFRLAVQRFDPTPLLASVQVEGWSPGTLDGSLEGSWRSTPEGALAGLEVRADLRLLGLRVGAERPAWELAIGGGLADGRLAIESVRGTAEDGATLDVRGTLPLSPAGGELLGPGDVDLALAAAGIDLARHLPEPLASAAWAEGVAALDVTLAGTWSRLDGTLALALEGWEGADLIGTSRLGPQALRLEVAAGDLLRLTALEVRGDGTRVDATGSLATPLDVAGWLRAPEALRAAGLELDARGELADLRFLRALTGALRRTEGTVEGDLALRGSLGAPEWTAEFRLREGQLRLPAGLPLLRELSADLALDPQRLVIRSLQGEAGGAPVEAEGTVELGGDEPDLRLALRGTNVLLARSSDLRVRADLDLRVEGPLSSLFLGGDVTLTGGRYARNVDFVRSYLDRTTPEASAHRGIAFTLSRDPPLAHARLDVRVRSREPFRVDTNLAQLYLRPELAVRGSGEVPVLEGSVYMGPSRISLPSGRLRMRSGQIEFTRLEPFDPTLAISGELTAQGYRIQANLQGSLDDPEILLSSDPPLPNDELLLLFLTGRRPETRGNEALQSVAVYLANDFLTSMLFSRDPDAAEGFAERFDYESGGELTKSGAPTGRATFLLHERRPTRRLSQYLVTEFDKYDDVNFGYGVLFRFR